MPDLLPECSAVRSGASRSGPGMDKRDVTLDILRGVAICLMVQDHVATSILGLRFPVWCEVYVVFGSFVPALFVMLAGMSVVYTSIHKNYVLKHYFFRAIFLSITAAVIVDAWIWGLIPFVSGEILYLIALSLPLAHLFQRLNATVRWSVIMAIVMLTPVLQHVFGYTPYPSEWSLSGVQTHYSSALNTTGIFHHWIIDGWFPIFPWLGVSFIGVNLGLMRWKTKTAANFAAPRIIAVGTLLVMTGVLLWMVSGTALHNRGGFREMIYPPTIAYLATSFGQIVLLFCLVDWRPYLKLYLPFIVFGESSLFLYWFHLGVTELFPFRPALSERIGTIFVSSLIFFLGFGYLMRSIRKKFPDRGPVLKYILGI